MDKGIILDKEALIFLKDHPEIARNLKVEITASELLKFLESFKIEDSDILLTPEQACELIQCTVQGLKNWDDKGITKPLFFGRKKMYRRSELLNIGRV